MTYGNDAVIQRYILNPHLLDGYKYDLRIYVLVTSFNPLEAFVYDEGFVRFSTVPYSTEPEQLKNKFIHLTNSSIQKHNESSVPHAGGTAGTAGTAGTYCTCWWYSLVVLVGGTRWWYSLYNIPDHTLKRQVFFLYVGLQ